MSWTADYIGREMDWILMDGSYLVNKLILMRARLWLWNLLGRVGDGWLSLPNQRWSITDHGNNPTKFRLRESSWIRLPKTKGMANKSFILSVRVLKWVFLYFRLSYCNPISHRSTSQEDQGDEGKKKHVNVLSKTEERSWCHVWRQIRTESLNYSDTYSVMHSCILFYLSWW